MKKRPTIKNPFGTDEEYFNNDLKKQYKIKKQIIHLLDGLSVYESKVILKDCIDLVEISSNVCKKTKHKFPSFGFGNNYKFDFEDDN